MNKSETRIKRLNKARKDLENRIKAIGWERDSSNNNYAVVMQTKGLLKSYLHFKDEAQKYSKFIDKKTVFTDYSFSEDLRYTLNLLKNKSCPLTSTLEFMNIGHEYYNSVKNGLYSDLNDKKGEEVGIRQIKDTLIEIKEFLNIN